MKKKQTPVVLLSVVVVLVGGAVIMNNVIPNSQHQVDPSSVVQSEMNQVDLKNPNRVLANPEAPGAETLSALATRGKTPTYTNPNEDNNVGKSVVMNQKEKMDKAKNSKPAPGVTSFALQQKLESGKNPK